VYQDIANNGYFCSCTLSTQRVIPDSICFHRCFSCLPT